MNCMLSHILSKHFNLTPVDLPNWLDPVVENESAVIRSYSWTSDRCRRIRLCDLEIKDKFTAVTLVIYPEFKYETPIFGTEYLRIGGKKFFGATDFHPVRSGAEYEQEYILNYLGDMPDRDKENSKFYDLTKFFSRKFWLKKETTDFWDEYIKTTDLFLNRYRTCLFESKSVDSLLFGRSLIFGWDAGVLSRVLHKPSSSGVFPCPPGSARLCQRESHIRFWCHHWRTALRPHPAQPLEHQSTLVGRMVLAGPYQKQYLTYDYTV